MAYLVHVDDLETLPEGLRQYYVENPDEKIGGYVFDGEQSESGIGIGNVKNLGSALNKERSARKALEKSMKAFDGIDPDDARASIDKLENWNEDNLEKNKEAKAEMENRIKKMGTQHSTEKVALEEAIANKDRKINQLIVDNDAQTELSTRERVGDVALLLPHVRLRTKVKEEDGEYTRIILDKNGDPEVDSAGNPITSMKFLCDKLEKEHPGAFEGSGAEGGDNDVTRPGGDVTPMGETCTRVQWEQMGTPEQDAFTEKGGVVKD